MLHAHCYVLIINVIGIITLETSHSGSAHQRIHKRILAVVLVNAGPAGVAAQVESGRESPGTVARTRFVGTNLRGNFCNVGIERCGNRKVLREESCARGICGAMVLIKAIDGRHANGIHRPVLERFDDRVPHLGSLRSAGHIEERANLVFVD